MPFGWTLAEDGELIEDASQQAAIARMKAMRDAGQSLRGIAAALQAEGFALSHAGVQRVIGPTGAMHVAGRRAP